MSRVVVWICRVAYNETSLQCFHSYLVLITLGDLWLLSCSWWRLSLISPAEMEGLSFLRIENYFDLKKSLQITNHLGIILCDVINDVIDNSSGNDL